MQKLLQISTNDGSEFFIEVNEPSVTESVRGFSAEEGTRGIIQDTAQSFERALSPLKDISASIMNCIKDIANSPKEVTVELGLRFTAKAGIILTSLDSEANLKVVLKWQKENKDEK